MSAWAIFGATSVGGLLSGSAVVVGVLLAQRAEAARSQKADLRRLRDIKGERLRQLYEPLVEFVLVQQQVVSEKTILRDTETPTERNERHVRMVSDSVARVRKIV